MIGSSGKTARSIVSLHSPQIKGREERLEAPNDACHNKAWMTRDANRKQEDSARKPKEGGQTPFQ